MQIWSALMFVFLLLPSYKGKKAIQITQALYVVLSAVSWLDVEECRIFSGSCFSTAVLAVVSQFPSGQLLMAKCLLIWDDKNLAVIVEKMEDLENQPNLNCNLILCARSNSLTFAQPPLSPPLTPKGFGVLGPPSSPGLSESIREI